jgi:hypothetical protein
MNAPTTLAQLNTYIQELYTRLGNSTSAKYAQFAFPAAYACHVYEPSIRTGAELAAEYQRGKWYLPSMGELVRLFHHWNISRANPRTTSATGDNSAVPDRAYYNYDVVEGHEGVDAWNPVFAKALKRLYDAGVRDAGATGSVFVNLTASGHRSSTESLVRSAWSLNFSAGNCWNFSKCIRNRVRAVTAYLFNIL